MPVTLAAAPETAVFPVPTPPTLPTPPTPPTTLTALTAPTAASVLFGEAARSLFEAAAARAAIALLIGDNRELFRVVVVVGGKGVEVVVGGKGVEVVVEVVL